jgi:DNA polymerase III delta prime subunit
MNKRLKELAEQAGLSREFSVSGLWLADDEELERFAELVRQDEREAIAALCEEASLYFEDDRASASYAANYCADEIRKRGDK